jgi:glycosyltransferase involved in cell wall biosynthesis
MRVALLTNILTPYRLPVYRDLAATPGWQLRVMLGAAEDPSWQRAFAGAYDEGRASLDVEIVAGLSLRRRVRAHGSAASEQWATLHVPFGAFAALRRFAPDVVVTSELGPRTAFAAAYAALHRTPLVIWTYHARSAAAAVGPARRALRRALLTRADAVVGMGIQAREVLRGLGVPEAILFDAPNAHAAEWWETRLGALDVHAERLALRASLGARERQVSRSLQGREAAAQRGEAERSVGSREGAKASEDQRIALVAGRLEASKGILPLLDAWRALPDAARAGWTLLFVGEGPLAGTVDEARSACRAGAIAVLPALRPDDLAGVYAASDLLVFPSLGDPWGLVVNEAMACGLPVLCSRLAGCADDLIAPGENGWLCDPTDPADLRAALAAALSDPARDRIAARARDTAKRFGPATLANGLRRAVLSAAARR